PCFWIYAEVGRDIHARARAANPYQAWIDTYAGEEFHAAVRAVIAATDEAAADVSPSLRARMHAAFTRATQLERGFWDSAFRLETWPVQQSVIGAASSLKHFPKPAAPPRRSGQALSVRPLRSL